MDYQLSPEELEELRVRGYKNPIFFLRTFLTDWFPARIPWVHRGIAAIYLRRADFLRDFDDEYTERDFQKILSNFFWKDSKGKKHYVFQWSEDEPEKITMILGRNVLIMMPRGFSKTTLVNGLEVFSILYRETDFDLLVSATQGHAAKSVTAIAQQLVSNPLIRACFGNLRPAQRSGIKWSESEGEVTTLSGISLLAKGAGSQIRGSHINSKRPKRIIVDDLEDRETVGTEEQRKKLKQWFFSDLKYALPRTIKTGTITVLATLLHLESLPTVMWDDPDYVSVVFGVYDNDGEPLWEEAMSEEEIEADKVSMASKSLLHVHYLELHNKIVPPEEQSFSPDNIIVFPRKPSALILKGIVLDPAISEERRADYASIATGGITEDGFFHISEVWLDKGKDPQFLLNKFFAMAREMEMTSRDVYGIESIAYQKALLYYVRQMMFSEKMWFEVKGITHGNEKKVPRILGELHGRYKSRSVTHGAPMPLYVSQLLDFPNGKKDGPDAVSMLFNLLGPGVHNVGMAGQEKSLVDDEYEPLDEMLGDWRRY